LRIALTAGVKYPISVGYVDSINAASVSLTKQSASQPSQIIPYNRLFPETPAPTTTGTPANSVGLTGEYFANNNFTNLVYTQTDPVVNFDWGNGGPSGLPGDNFSIRWSGYVQPRFSETYTFCSVKNDMARLYVNGQKLFDHSYYQTVEKCGSIALSAGVKYSITLEFADYENAATVNLTWSSPTQYKEIIPASQLFPANPTPTPTGTPTPTITPSSTPTETQTPTQTPPQTPSGQVWRTYYYAGSQRVAVRVTGSANPQENGLYYTLGDHLGSTSLVTDTSGNKVGEIRYTPWGETRFEGSNIPSNYKYTGQREEAGIGLYYFNARWYDAQLGRFAQADPIISSGPRGNDRYAYVKNSPLIYSDPTGNRVCEVINGETYCGKDLEFRTMKWFLSINYQRLALLFMEKDGHRSEYLPFGVQSL
jgi:RHS repeat-associated protein